MAREPKYISLKEAAELSGYSADYIGQLIRKGKLPGKQVFLNVAWMTTEDALQQYMHKDVTHDEKSWWMRAQERVLSLEGLSKIYAYGLWGAIGLLSIFVLILIYILAVSIDHTFEVRALQAHYE